MVDSRSEPFWLSAHDLVDAYHRRDLTPVDVVNVLRERIEGHDPDLNSFVALDPGARSGAAESTERIRRGSARPLEGVPVAVKDLLDTRGLATTYGSGIYRHHVPETDAVAVQRLRAAGAIVLGKTATHEFAWGVTTDNPHHGPTRNPWDHERVPGGSSGGSAAAVAAGFCPLAIGTDTAGSVRIPASLCGVVGLRPTHGAVDTGGTHPLAPTLDTIGGLGRTVADVRLLHQALDPHAAATAELRPDARLRVGMLPQLGDQEPGATDGWIVNRTIGLLEDTADLDVVEVPDLRLDVPDPFAVMSTIVLTEGLASHMAGGTWPQRAAEYGPDVRARLETAQAVTFDAYVTAQRQRVQISHAIRSLFQHADVLVSPVASVPPKRIVDRGPAAEAQFREGVMRNAAPQSLSGLPSCAVPIGLVDGLPVGVQLTARAGRDFDALAVAAAIQSTVGVLRPVDGANAPRSTEVPR
jgi:aspartyl-tRNA(Asn)/glutamyl-tRNA(Gln) amidotransferase subunit A